MSSKTTCALEQHFSMDLQISSNSLSRLLSFLIIVFQHYLEDFLKTMKKTIFFLVENFDLALDMRKTHLEAQFENFEADMFHFALA